jgi:hypothetical protein
MKKSESEIAMSHADKMAIANTTTTIFPGAYYRGARTLCVRFPAEDRTVELWLDPEKWDPRMMAVLARSIRANRVLAQCPMEVALDWFALSGGLIAVRVEDEITGGIRAGVTVMLNNFDDNASSVRKLERLNCEANRQWKERWQKFLGWFTRKPKEATDAVRSDADAQP